jgi:16S rRNA (cytosine967-C5)-methyltransferase
MSRYYSYINTAALLINQYSGKELFNLYLKNYFSANKKYGSKDRKQISHLCYCFFRLGKSLKEMKTEERLLAGLFLCSSDSNELLAYVKPEWNNKVYLTAKEKFENIFSEAGEIYKDSNLESIFPWKKELSPEIDFNFFCSSFFNQPDLFLRLRPGMEMIVKQKLKQAAIEFTNLSESCISLPNTSKVDTIINLDKEAVIQDYSSQQVGSFLKMVKKSSPYKVWDCCAASGGKAILANDILENIELTVSDVRENILFNLKKRFSAAGIKNYTSKVLNIGNEDFNYKDEFDLVIADVPCSGSGTWSRTPEQLFYFDEKKINEFSSLQKKIIKNVLPNLKAGGFLLYITCSVFKKENEEIAAYIQEELKQNLIAIKVLEGFTKKADTMFIALLQKPLLSD